jgi:hypothetical protein
MTIVRIRAELADERGRLGGLASAIAACRGNILGVDVHFLEGARVADEFVIHFPEGSSGASLVTALRRAGGIALQMEELDQHALVDPVARALDLAALLFAGGRADERLAASVAQLVRADRTRFADAVDGAPSDVPVTTRNQVALPYRDATARRWLVVERAVPPFSSSEVARMAAVLRLADAARAGPSAALPAPAPVRRRPATFFPRPSAVRPS